MLRPSLHRHYPVSSVILRNPTPYRPFGFLVLDLSAILKKKEPAGSPKFTILYLCVACQDLRPRGAGLYSPYRLVQYCLLLDRRHRPFPFWSFRGSTSSAFAFGLLPLLPTLRLTVTWSAPRLDNGGWLNLTIRDSHPLYMNVLLGAPRRYLTNPSYSIANHIV